jgi:glycosyltransferase involved in cell wall biosynthesis
LNSAPASILNVIRYPIGGIRSYLRYTYSRLDPLRYRTTIVTVDRDEARLIPPGIAPIAADLHTVSERNAFAGLALMTGRLLARDNFGLVHSQGTTAAIVADLSARRHGVPHIVTLHETFRPEQFRGVIGRIRRASVARSLNRADSIIAVTEDAAANLLSSVPLDRATRGRLQVIRNGVASTMLADEAPRTRLQLRQTYGLTDNTVLLGYIGRFMPEKGFDVLLDAVERLQRDGGGVPQFVIAAVNDGAYLREYRQEIAARGLEAHFIFAGFQSSAAGVLSELDGVVMPSRREACGIVAMEAMVLGCPLIASDCIGLRELTRGTPALACTTGDAGSLAETMRRFLISVADQKRAAQAYMTAARADFDSAVAASQLDRTFQAVLHPQPLHA